MSAPASSGSSSGRETRFLLVTIAISVAVLLLLAQFRFPDEPSEGPVDAAPAPLERLAAQATYDELATIMADLERRIAPRVSVVRIAGESTGGELGIAARLGPDRAISLLYPEQRTEGISGGSEVLAEDLERGVTILRVPAVEDAAVAVRAGAPRPGPRYLALVEATALGVTVRPVYVGRIQQFADERTRNQQLSLTGLQDPLPRGAAIFSLEGNFMGLVRDAGSSPVVMTAEFLRAALDAVPTVAAQPRGTFGVEVEGLSAAVSTATGARNGVVVTHAAAGGPSATALQSGDVIQSIDNAAVTTVAGFRQAEAARPPGAVVAVAGIRRGSPLNVSVTTADAAATPPVTPPDDAGFVGRFVPGAGLEVVMVSERSAAASAGLQRGDLIVASDGEPVRDSMTIARRYRAADAGRSLLVTVRRGGRHHVLALEKR